MQESRSTHVRGCDPATCDERVRFRCRTSGRGNRARYRPTLCSVDGFGGREIGCVGQQCQLSVKEFGTHDGLFIKVPAKTVRLQVRLDEPAQFRFGDGPGKSAIGPAISGAPSASGLPFALSVELGNYFLRTPSNFLIRARRRSVCSFARTGSWATMRR